ncbi:MAG TPA: SLBB domain-containing protein [Vicinamibacterales bacterium]|jgi:polysaccharide export outer membrane protein|nr:SLBB domain-containing protein [Vicinamibacterales bacterium]
MACRRRIALAVGLMALSIGVIAAQQAPTIAVRDQVKVTVVGTEIPTGPFPVDADGAIDYPYIGRVKAVGLTARELGTELAKRLVTAQVLVGSPQVSVELMQTANKKVTVSGAVNNKGEFPFSGELSVFSALVKAGGASQDAGDEVLLIRAPKDLGTAAAGQAAGDEDDDVITLSRKQIESGEFDGATLVEDGDRIVVSKARQVYIDGQVSRPGGYTIEAGTTLRQALSLAGGVTDLGAVNRVRVLRNGKRLDKVDLDKTIIQPGDTITVPKRFM